MEQLKDWLIYYDLEKYLFDVVHERLNNGQFSPEDFFAIVLWKSNRAKGLIAKGLTESKFTRLMTQIASCALSDEGDKERLKLLDDIEGIGLPIASAILTVWYPDRFTVLDYRVWEILRLGYEADLEDEWPKWRGKKIPEGVPQTTEDYFKYLKVCKKVREREGMLTLRDFDRATWAKSWHKDLRKLVSESLI